MSAKRKKAAKFFFKALNNMKCLSETSLLVNYSQLHRLSVECPGLPPNVKRMGSMFTFQNLQLVIGAKT